MLSSRNHSCGGGDEVLPVDSFDLCWNGSGAARVVLRFRRVLLRDLCRVVFKLPVPRPSDWRTNLYWGTARNPRVHLALQQSRLGRPLPYCPRYTEPKLYAGGDVSTRLYFIYPYNFDLRAVVGGEYFFAREGGSAPPGIFGEVRHLSERAPHGLSHRRGPRWNQPAPLSPAPVYFCSHFRPPRSSV